MRLVFCGCVQLRTANLRHCESIDHANLRGRLFIFGKVPDSSPVLVVCVCVCVSLSLSLENTSRQTTGHVVLYIILTRAAYMHLKYWPSNVCNIRGHCVVLASPIVWLA